MSTIVEELASRMLGLPASERAALAQKLLASLEKTEESDVENLWVQEAEKRYKRICEGEVAGKPGEEVLSDARSKLK